MARGMKLSDCVFPKYISAKDFEIGSLDFVGSRNLGIYSDLTITYDREQTFTTMISTELSERVEFLIKRVEGL